MIEAVVTGWPLCLVAGLFGLLVGSFLNVVILRLPARLMHEWRQQSRELLGLDAAAATHATAGPASQTSGEAAPSIPAQTAIHTPHLPSEATPQAAADSEATNPTTSAVSESGNPHATVAAEPETAPPDLVFKGSHCPHCKHALSPLDNIPVVSWLALRGRCRYCKAPISAQYPLVELLSAVVAAIVVWRYGFSLQSVAGLGLSFSLIALSGIDLRTQLLPDTITLPLLWAGLLLSLFPLFVVPEQAIAGGAIGYLSLWSVYWLFKLATGKEGMGYGDFKLLGALGAWLGPMSLLPIVLISSLLGAVIGSIALAVRRQDRSTPIPFGPFIAVAGWLQFIWGDALQRWYTQFFFLL